MMMKQLLARIQQEKGARQVLQQQVSAWEDNLETLHIDLVDHEQAREILREVGIKTQQILQYHISDITTLALNSVFDDPYELKVEFVSRRNKTECDLVFVRGGQEVEPLEASGYGAVDVASFALRVASWSMQHPRSRNVIILDEPMRFLSEDRQQAASQMIKELSDKLGIQFIIVTHEEVLTQAADKVFHVRMKEKETIISIK